MSDKHTNDGRERVPEEPEYDVSEDELETLRYLRENGTDDMSEVARALLEVVDDE